jgi:hypothetical protein
MTSQKQLMSAMVIVSPQRYSDLVSITD